MSQHVLSVGALKVRKRVEAMGSQTAVADALGLSQQYIYKIITGERVPTRWDVVELFRARFRIAPRDWTRFPSQRTAPPEAA